MERIRQHARATRASPFYPSTMRVSAARAKSFSPCNPCNLFTRIAIPPMTDQQIYTLLAVAKWQKVYKPDRAIPARALADAFGVAPQSLANALRMNGWQRDRVRSMRDGRRFTVTFWVPPNGEPPRRRQRGRPSFAELFN